MPSSNFRKDTQGLEQWQVSLLIQMRTGHIPLQAYLHRIGKVDTPTCLKCHNVDETVHNYLTACTAFITQRRHMESRLQRAAKDVRILLTNPKVFMQLFEYVCNMGQFCYPSGGT